ncbi:MAG: cysteine synthase A [Clostridia bacterium]|nr:cysteine synthase A [Clostridia bacterium]
MPKIYKSADELIGNTPLLELSNIEKNFNLKAKIFAKLEYLNPTGSSKDRAAKFIVDGLKKSGKLKENTVIIEATSGNTGIGLASYCAVKGIKLIIVMPENMSDERKKTMRALGAELVLTDSKKGMSGSIEKAEELNKSIPDSIIAGQFVNFDNVKAHYETTGPEIYYDTDGKVDIFVAGVGTGGTLTGTGRYLKEKIKGIKVVAVEPETSAVLSGEEAGKHNLQGIGAGFVPEILDTDVYDEVITVSDNDAYILSRAVSKSEGILVGISSGAALKAAVDLASRPESEGKNIVVLLPDTGDRYLSTELFE